jgi:hypothetical protein
MNKKLFGILIVGFVLMLASSSLASAYYYGGYNNDFDRRTYHSTWESNGQFRSTDYDKTTSSAWINGQYVSTTSYVKTTVDSPRYGYGYSPYYYQNSYRPWYQKYWDQPRYGYGGYGGYSGGYNNLAYYPSRTYYRFGY